MNVLCVRVLMCVGLVWLSACSTAGNKNGIFSNDNVLHTMADATPVKAEVKNAAVLRVHAYVDQRAERNPRLLGELTTRVFGLDGRQLIVDHDVADIVTASLRNRFRKAGYTVLDDGDAQASTFELTGVVKALSMNVRERDDISIAIETNVTETATGKIIWSGQANEKNNRFAGISGNTRNDLVDYLNHELRVANDKTVEAVGTLLMASYPALFNLVPGTKPVAGVTVYSAPAATVVTQTPMAVPVPAAVALPIATPSQTTQGGGQTGLFVLSSKPTRAKVYVDGVYFGLTPLRAEMEPGVHSIEVKLDGRKTDSEKISVRKGETTELELSLQR